MNIYIYILYTNMYQLSHTVLSSTPFKFVSSTSFRLSLGEFECGDSLESNIAFFLMDLPAFLAIARNRDLGALRRNITWVLWVGCASGGGLSSNSILLSWKELVQPQDSHPLPWYIRFFEQIVIILCLGIVCRSSVGSCLPSCCQLFPLLRLFVLLH